jgi:hypothetical protein
MRIANKARKTVAKTMRNMQVPVYCPVDAGVHSEEKRGVVVDVKKVMAIRFIVMLEDNVFVNVGMDIPPMVLVEVPGIDMVIDMSEFILVCKVL